MKKTGDIGEIIAIEYLQKHDFTIRDTNFKFGRFGEIDVIAEKFGRVYFIEVKYRTHLGYGHPEEAIVPHKLYKCLKTMQYYCKRNGLDLENIQFDVLAILKKQTAHQVTHYKNIELY
ncbi:YraN family protein [Candidatus Gracilibacteria bacterium]|nr:YraN family protein [Candidatus Gracilibacteria bacterium]